MYSLNLKLDHPNTSYRLSKIAAKMAQFQEKNARLYIAFDFVKIDEF